VAVLDEKTNNCLRNDANRIIMLDYANKRLQLDTVVVDQMGEGMREINLH
jgi:hypothetical protein